MTLAAINNLAVVLEYEGDLPEAERLMREALDGGRRVLGSDHPDTLVWIEVLVAVENVNPRSGFVPQSGIKEKG